MEEAEEWVRNYHNETNLFSPVKAKVLVLVYHGFLIFGDLLGPFKFSISSLSCNLYLRKYFFSV